MRSIPRACLFAVLSVLISIPVRAAEDGGPKVFESGGAALADAKKKFAAGDPQAAAVVKTLRDRAEKMLADGPFTVTQKKHPLSGVDVHDYVSLAPYFWPNPDTANGLPYVRHDGQRNPEIHDYDAKPLGDLSEHVYTLALAGYLTGDQRFSDRAGVLLRAWFFDPATRMNPNLSHAQLIKGTNDGRGTGIIETLRFLPVIDAVGLLHDSPSWTADDQSKIEAWFSDYLNWLQKSANGKDEAAAENNHGSWYDAQVVAYMLFLGHTDEARQVVEAAESKRVAKQIEPDGQEPLELVRATSFHYSVYNLSALSLLADLGKRVDVDLWNFQTKDGRGIRKVIDWLIPYATGQQKWTHEEIAGVESHDMVVPLRRAAAAYHDEKYETAISHFHGVDLRNDLDNLRFPPNYFTPTNPNR
jgi:Alginate lyase